VGGAGGDNPPRYGSLLPPIYTPCKPPTRVESHHKITLGVCKHSRYSEVLLASARGFYLSSLERVFHVKILCLRAVISFSFFVIAYRFYNNLVLNANYANMVLYDICVQTILKDLRFLSLYFETDQRKLHYMVRSTRTICWPRASGMFGGSKGRLQGVICYSHPYVLRSPSR
jgi:hypothetical protein